MIRLISLVVQAYNRKVYSACFFLDLRKAFDTVPHELLIKKLEHYGFRGQCSTYMASYYRGRQQYVHVDGENSSTRSVTCGVPQGSILGPICFSLFINDLPNAVKEEVVLFADDAAFFIVSDTLEGLYEKISKLFLDLTAYLSMNRLSPNSRKSKLLMFKSRPTQGLRNFSFGGEDIEWVSEFKYLGLMVTSKMNYSKHIDTVALKVSRITGTFTCLRSFVPKNILIKLYYALLFPHLNNHIIVWGSAPPSNLKTLIIRVNNILRVILGVKWRNGKPLLSNDELYKQLDVMKINSIYKYNLYKFLRLILDGELPQFWQLLLARYVSPHAYNTRNIRFRHPNIGTEVERRGLSYQLIMMLEDLPLTILETDFNRSVQHFKSILLTSQ